jgi:hypothetical protein
VLTARHNIDYILREYGTSVSQTGGREIADYSIRLYQVFEGPKYAVWDVRKIWCSAESDLALLNVELWGASDPAELNPAVGLRMRALPPARGSKVAGFGYHSQSANIKIGKQNNNYLNLDGVAQATTGVVEDVFECGRDAGLYNFPCFQVNARFDSGMSGGPVFDEMGHLVGIVSGSLPPGEECYATSYVASIWPMLRILISAQRAGQPASNSLYPAIDLALEGILAVSDLSSLDPSWFPGRRLPRATSEAPPFSMLMNPLSILTKVTDLERLDGFRLRVRFNDGSEGVHDFTAMVNEPGMLEPLRDVAYFSRVFLEFGAPTWPNGFDIAPEWLRREMQAAGELTRVAAE